jgi:uncharacterized glyoxalase superfamily protein PhnB
MPANAVHPGTMIPTLRYSDAPAAIEWLCAAFGFERYLVVPGDKGTIVHAQLKLGGGMIMVGSSRDEDWNRSPTQAGGVTQSPYIVVEEIDAHYARAQAAGAEMTMEIADQEYGGRLYSARDPEGHLWHFGSYDPWATPG